MTQTQQQKRELIDQADAALGQSRNGLAEADAIYEAYEVRGPQPACNDTIVVCDTLAGAQAAADADAQRDADDDAASGVETNAWWGRSYEIRGYDGRHWRHIDDYQPSPAAAEEVR